MSVKIRLKRMGTKKRPFYRLVVTETRAAGASKYLEAIGIYSPVVEPKQLVIDQVRAAAWLERGAKPTPTVQHLLTKAGLR